MPPKKFSSFSKLKNLSHSSQNSTELESGKGCKQITISKFFTSTTKRKISDDDDKDGVILIVDENDEKSKNMKERTISSPHKKKAKMDDKATNNCLKTSTSVQQRSQQDDDAIVPTRISQLLARTKDKLQDFVAESEGNTIKKESVEMFDFNCLKREKAKLLSDYSDKRLEDVTSHNLDQDDEIGGTKLSETIQSKYHSDKLSKFVSLKTKGQRTHTQRRKQASKTEVGIKYTQLEQQFMEIKEKNPDTILFVECGYKYRFFGNDAEVAAEVLKIYCHMDHNFMTASIPVHRLFVHVRRLVSAGYKVGVVKQMETAALKAAGSNKSAPFSRQLTDLYTKATLIGEDIESGSSEGMEGQQTAGRVTNYLMCVCDNTTDPKANKSNKKDTVGIMAVQPSTGDIVYDSFQDCNQRAELETRLSHLHPVEVLISQHASASTEKLISGIQTVSPTLDDRLRIEKLDRMLFEYNNAFELVSEFYKESIANGTVKFQEIVNLPKPVICCLAGLITYLKDFKLDSIFLETSNFTQFSINSKFMQLNSCTLRNLEIFQNSTNGSERGSLFWALNQTVSKPGAQLLKSWLSRPLLDYSEIKDRQEAVAAILSGEFPEWKKIRGMLAGLPDLQRALTAVFYKKCSPLDFYNMCRSFIRVQDEFLIQKEALSGYVTSSLLSNLVKEIPELLTDIAVFPNAFVETAAKENDKTQLFADESRYPAIVKCKAEIESIKQEIHDHRREVRLTLRLPSLEYTTVSGTEYLIEVKNKALSSVPKSWSKISSTKTVSRFHSPFIVEKYKLLQQGREKLVIVCQEAWLAFLEEYLCCYQLHRKVVQLLATLDCLFSMATVACNLGYCRPEIVEDEVCVEIDGGRHPVIEELLGESQQYVPNDTKLNENGERVVIITGPNMGGKSSYIKQVAIISIMAQIGSYVPAQSARLGILDAVFTRMGAMDEIFSRRSTFMVELQEAADIMAKVTSRSLVILDELGRGTSTHDGTAIAHATLKYFITEPRCLTLFVTHYPLLAEFEQVYPGTVANSHMSFMVHDDQDSDFDKVTFLYQLVRGVASRSFGLNVASLADIPESVITKATQKSCELEKVVMNKRKQTICLQKIFSEDVGSIKEFIKSMET